ncbi:hypothetical protein BJ508DRAFT_233906 [Ascobolus immersus RN42]|uniref:Amine oxidase domain-containing protein n=1 Tax=Ascobolus immersus RN42 TaxID=1160509 RepID=A0A3N4INM3_ASCIM|nr:hypothetical protein BJ508DRAFT_233906 [Ascobolus immersus RN42]
MTARFHVLVYYDILEANNRIGGRIFTYRRFAELQPRPAHPYYDVGAHRFADILSMRRVFDLFGRLGLQKDGLVIPSNDDPGSHVHGSPLMPQMFTDSESDLSRDAHSSGNINTAEVTQHNNGTVPNSTIKRARDDVLYSWNILGKWMKALREDREGAISLLINGIGKYSVREYIKERGKPYDDFDTLQWLESSPGAFDISFSELILQAYDEEPVGKPVTRYTINGGCATIIDRMAQRVRSKPLLQHEVTGIAQSVDTKTLAVVVNRKGTREKELNYDAAFSSVPMPCLQKMDLSKAGLSAQQKVAIKAIKYQHVCKVAIVFEEAWWSKYCHISEGTALTDLPIKCVVYPSYNYGDEGMAVLIASFTINEDADRMGALITPNSPEGEESLVYLVLENLARLHSRHGITLEQLHTLYVDHHAFNWSTSEHTAGGAAPQYGPMQFQHFYPAMVIPAAKSKLFFIGEAISANHGWASGALDSAVRGVMQWLAALDEHEVLEELRKEWGMPGEMEGGEDGTLHLVVGLGHLEPQERIRV